MGAILNGGGEIFRIEGEKDSAADMIFSILSILMESRKDALWLS